MSLKILCSFPDYPSIEKEHKIYLSGLSNMKNVRTLLKDEGEVNTILGNMGLDSGIRL